MDRAFFPYGCKNPVFLFKRTVFLCWYLTRFKVDLIILACNTLSVLVLNDAKCYFKTPIMGVIELFDFEKYDNAIFIGTLNTIKYLEKKNKKIFFLATPKLIDYIEHNQIALIEKYLNKKRNLFDSYHYVLLGCTHFIRIKHLFKNAIAQDDLFNIKMLNGIRNT